MYDILIKGGTVIDPAQGLHEIRDIAIENGKIAQIPLSTKNPTAHEVVDAKGLIVVPGLIDLHVHAFWGGSTYGIEPDAGNISKGVTTVVDAGSAGASTFPAFRSHIIDRSKTSIYALLNIATSGMVFHDDSELHDLNRADVLHTVKTGLQNQDRVVGIKARLGRVQAANNDREALKRAIEAAELLNGFVMIHVGNSSTPLPILMDMLRPGDAVTHSFHGFGDGILDESGEIIKAMKEAQTRGIIIDVGHGSGGFSFRSAEKALDSGIFPGTISSDLHIHNIEGPVFDLATTMSKFMNLGMSIYEVIERSTIAPAKTMGKEAKIGSLKPGFDGDVTLMRIEEGKFEFHDRLSKATKLGSSRWEPGKSIYGSQRLAHVNTIKAGKLYRPWKTLI